MDTTSAPAPSPSTGGAGLLLDDIFGGSPAAPPTAMMQPTAQELGSIVAFEKNGLKVTIDCRREADRSATINCRFANALDAPMTKFIFEAAVPKYVTLKINPASGQMLPPRSETVNQIMSVVKADAESRPTMMKLRIGYMINGQQVQEVGDVKGFPGGI
jgi:AP-1 complex subunit gamma-1